MDIILPARTNIILDSQLLSTAMSCWRLYDWTFNCDLQPKGGKSVSMEMGSIVHAYFENKNKQIIQGMKKAQAIAFGMTAAIQYSKSDEVKNSTSEDIALAFDTCVEYEKYYLNDGWRPLEAEVVKSKEIYVDDNIRVIWKAKLDTVTNTGQLILPVDYKTMKQRRDTLSLNNQFMGQCIVQDTRQMIVDKVGFQKTLAPKDRFTRVVMNYTADRLHEWKQEIVPFYAYRLAEYSKTGKWPPNFTHCENKYGVCKFKDVCELNRNMRAEALRNDYIVGKKWDIGGEES
jgi:hypothetical protein